MYLNIALCAYPNIKTLSTYILKQKLLNVLIVFVSFLSTTIDMVQKNLRFLPPLWPPSTAPLANSNSLSLWNIDRQANKIQMCGADCPLPLVFQIAKAIEMRKNLNRKANWKTPNNIRQSEDGRQQSAELSKRQKTCKNQVASKKGWAPEH